MENIELNEIKLNIVNVFGNLCNCVSKDKLVDESSLIVRFKPDLSKDEIKLFEDEHHLKNKTVLIDELNIYQYDILADRKLNLDFLIEANQSDLDFYAEPNYKCHMCAEPYYNLEWGLKNRTYPQVDVNAEAAWKITKGDANVTVAVVDSGIDYTHSDLKANVWRNAKEIANNRIDDDRNGYVDDIIGWNFHDNNNLPYDYLSHGTHVSGIIAAPENNYGITGVSPKVKIMPLKVFGSTGNMSNMSNLLRALQFADKNKANIVNLSLSGRGFSRSLYDVMNSLRNTLFVCAAGNNGFNTDTNPCFPASYILPNNITVASIERNGAISSFSNYGIKTVDVAAPGSGIYSTIPGNRFGYMSGTSMAAPFVAGVAALIKSYKKNLTPQQIISVIEKNTKPLTSLRGRVKTGGLVNAGKALNSLK